MDNTENMRNEIQNLKKKALYSTVIYVTTVIIYNFTLIQCLFGYSRIQNYYQESYQLNRELSESLETMNLRYQQIAEDHEVLLQSLRQK